jgi:hypothetical protein
VKVEAIVQSMLPLEQLGGQCGAARERDHQQRGSDRERERQAEQQHERGHDHEAAADAEEAGQDARAETGGRDAQEREIAAGRG